MSNYVTGMGIKTLREKKRLTQKQLAEVIGVSDKAVSKWETGRGLPDLSLLAPLSSALGVSVAELLSGEQITNRNRAANPLRGTFYLCPVCGNIIHAMGEGAFHCCGVALPPLEAEEEDSSHTLLVKEIDGQWHVSLAPPMEKDHFLTFLAQVSGDRVDTVKLYPEGQAQAWFPKRGPATLYACCNRHGLFQHMVTR